MESTVTRATAQIIRELSGAAITIVDIIDDTEPSDIPPLQTDRILRVMTAIRNAQDVAYTLQMDLYE